jgi:hypothetical protein
LKENGSEKVTGVRNENNLSDSRYLLGVSFFSFLNIPLPEPQQTLFFLFPLLEANNRRNRAEKVSARE